jgi:hypothetical protein
VTETGDQAAAGGLQRNLDESGLGLASLAAIGSVALALYYVRSDTQRGQFIGLWPATILGFASYREPDALQRLVQQADD